MLNKTLFSYLNKELSTFVSTTLVTNKLHNNIKFK